MPVTWSFPHLAWILLAGGISIVAGLSRKRPMHEAFVLIHSAVYLVLNGILWIYFLVTSTWDFGIKMFRFDFDPLLPAVSFWLGVFVQVAIIASWISVWSKRDHYSRRQVCAHTVSTLIFWMATLVSTLTPVRVQQVIDALPSPP